MIIVLGRKEQIFRNKKTCRLERVNAWCIEGGPYSAQDACTVASCISPCKDPQIWRWGSRSGRSRLAFRNTPLGFILEGNLTPTSLRNVRVKLAHVGWVDPDETLKIAGKEVALFFHLARNGSMRLTVSTDGKTITSYLSKELNVMGDDIVSQLRIRGLEFGNGISLLVTALERRVVSILAPTKTWIGGDRQVTSFSLAMTVSSKGAGITLRLGSLVLNVEEKTLGAAFGLLFREVEEKSKTLSV